jgi:hypothetical protein
MALLLLILGIGTSVIVTTLLNGPILVAVCIVATLSLIQIFVLAAMVRMGFYKAGW